MSAREHYAVPRAFQRLGQLRSFYTEVWCRYGSSALRRGPRSLRAFATRQHPELHSQNVVSFTSSTLIDQCVRKFLPRKGTVDDQHSAYVRDGKAFCNRVNRHLRRQKLDPSVDVFFGFDTGCLETLHLLNEQHLITVVDQIDPARTEENLVLVESEKWPGWTGLPGRVPVEYYDRLAAEWAAASMVLVNSEWSKKALVEQGVHAQKIVVVPLAYEPSISTPMVSRRNTSGPLTVLWLGSVILRKGIQYLIGAAQILANSNIRFVVAGTVGISADAIATAPPNMSFVGSVTRDQTSDYYRQADLFVLPTVSDGFGLTQLEAMAHGLPVITTPNCGAVVDHGNDGFIVRACDSEALAGAIAELDSDRPTLQSMSAAAITKSRQFSLERYAQTVESHVRDFRLRAAF